MRKHILKLLKIYIVESVYKKDMWIKKSCVTWNETKHVILFLIVS